MKRAGVDRARLEADTNTEEPVDFRSLRDSGITWLALAGVDVAKMQRRAGHDDPSTTFGHLKLAEDLGGTIGEPFAARWSTAFGASQRLRLGHLATFADRSARRRQVRGITSA